MSRLLYLIRLMIVLLLVFALGKVAFMTYNSQSMDAFTASDVWQVLLHGFTMDLSTCGYLLIIPWLFCFISLWTRTFSLRKVLLPYFFLIGILLVSIIGGDAVLYEFWKFKLNASVFSYMQNPEGAVSSVSMWFIASRLIAILLATFFIILALVYVTPKRLNQVSHSILRSLGMILLGGLLFVCIRGGVQESTMNVGVAYYSPSLFLNHSAVNPVFSLMSSIKRTKDYAAEFDWLQAEELEAAFDGLYPSQTEDIADTLLTTTRPNILVVMMESFGSKFVAEMGGIKGVAPNLSRLIPEGIFWENFYANSFRTDRGTVSLYSGWISYPTVSLMRLPDKVGTLPSIAHSLQRVGYSTHYLYGGDIKIMGKKGYLVAAGYEKLTSDEDFSLSEVNESKWGVNDSVAARRTFEIIRGKPADTPWHMVFQTLSSHEPFEVPYHRLADKKLNAFAFTDACVGALVDSLRTLPSWDNTLVILLPDHGYLYELTYESPEFFHCPMLWLGGAIKTPRRMSCLMNQSDLAATLLSQLSIPHAEFPWSRNVLSRQYTYPFVYCNYPSGILFRDSTGVTVYDIDAQQFISESPSPSPERILKAKAILQTSYDCLGEQ